MSNARSGSDWDCRALLTSCVVNPGLRVSSHVSNCLVSGVLGFGFGGCGCDGNGGGMVVVVVTVAVVTVAVVIER